MLLAKKISLIDKPIELINDEFLANYDYYEENNYYGTVINIVRIIAGDNYIHFDLPEEDNFLIDNYGFINGLNMSCSATYWGKYRNLIEPQYGAIRPWEYINYCQRILAKDQFAKIKIEGNCFETVDFGAYLLDKTNEKYNFSDIDYEFIFNYKRAYHVMLRIKLENRAFIFELMRNGQEGIFFSDEANYKLPRDYEVITKEELPDFRRYFDAFVLFRQNKCQYALNILEKLYKEYPADFVYRDIDRIKRQLLK
jgi:hypothetical protein